MCHTRQIDYLHNSVRMCRIPKETDELDLRPKLIEIGYKPRYGSALLQPSSFGWQCKMVDEFLSFAIRQLLVQPQLLNSS